MAAELGRVSFDAPYEAQTLVLKPWHGAMAGWMGGLVAYFAMQEGDPFKMVPFGVMAGVMYALCQQRAPLHGLAAVGLFYGFFLWLVFGVVLGGLILDETTARALHSKHWLMGGLAYGATLACTSIIWTVTHKQADLNLPKD